jgi:glycosyltransferase involved in cell wall biosynthesis
MQHQEHPDASLCSVVVVTYNRAHWLLDCVRSVRESGVSNLEIVVVDDGSTDATPELADQLGSDVRYIYQRNAGVAAARNHGARQCRGRYLAFLDSDDRWLAGAHARLVRLLEEHPTVDVAFGDAQVGSAQEGYRGLIEKVGPETVWSLPGWDVGEGARAFEQASFFRRVAGMKPPVFIGATVVRRTAFDAVGGFDERLDGGDDWELWMRLAAQHTFALDRRPSATWEKHAGNMSKDGPKMQDQSVKALRAILAKGLALGAAERAVVRQHLRQIVFGWAYEAFDRSDLMAARERFAACIELEGAQPRLVFYWLCSWLRPQHVQRLRALKWRLQPASVGHQ